MLAAVLIGSLVLFATCAAISQDSSGSDNVRGLSCLTQSTNVLLTWPSDPRESFLVLARSNASPETQWTILTNHLPASPLTNSTAFLDIGGSARPHAGQPKSNLRDFY